MQSIYIAFFFQKGGSQFHHLISLGISRDRWIGSVSQTSSPNSMHCGALCKITQFIFRWYLVVLVWGGRGRHVKLCLGRILWYIPNHSPASAAVRCASPWTTDQSPRALLTDTEMLHCPTWLFLPASLLLHVKQSATVPLPASREERGGYHELSGCYVPGIWSLRTVRAQSFSVHQHFTGKQVSAQCHMHA